jgi:hypothetical protein
MAAIKLYLSNLAIAIARMAKAPLGMYKYSAEDGWFKNVMVTLDCLGNTLALGDPDETISSRSAKAQAYEQSTAPPSYGWGCRMCSFLAIFQENHCAKALERNKGSRAVNPDQSV